MLDFDRLAIAPAFMTFGKPATYTPPAGDPVPCTAILTEPDVDWRDNGSVVTTAARIAEVRVSEAAVMEEEGTLAIGGQTFTIQKASRPDADRLLWWLELR